jgi:Glycosyl transferases group 1
MSVKRRLGILIWHIHGSYLNSLARLDHDWYVPVTPERGPRYGGRGASFDLPANLREVPAERVRDLDLDLVIYQAPENLSEDRERILSPEQRRLPAIYLEHNTPRPHPVETRHSVDDPDMLLVHVTHYNRLMWDSGRTPTMVIEHAAAIDPLARYEGARPEGVAVINEIARRGRIAGYDLYREARERLPITLAGMGSAALGGLGDLPYRDLHRSIAAYRFLYSPMRYTSLPLAVVEAMLIGMPVVALATTELPSVIADGVNGFVSCDHGRLIEDMRALLEDRALAARLGAAARETALARFGIERFALAWDAAFRLALGR